MWQHLFVYDSSKDGRAQSSNKTRRASEKKTTTKAARIVSQSMQYTFVSFEFLVFLLRLSLFTSLFNSYRLQYPIFFYISEPKQQIYQFRFQLTISRKVRETPFTSLSDTFTHSHKHSINTVARYVWPIYSRRSKILLPYLQTQSCVLLHIRKCHFSNQHPQKHIDRHPTTYELNLKDELGCRQAPMPSKIQRNEKSTNVQVLEIQTNKGTGLFT